MLVSLPGPLHPFKGDPPRGFGGISGLLLASPVQTPLALEPLAPDLPLLGRGLAVSVLGPPRVRGGWIRDTGHMRPLLGEALWVVVLRKFVFHDVLVGTIEFPEFEVNEVPDLGREGEEA